MKNFNRYECKECKKVYRDVNLKLQRIDEKHNRIYFCIRCHNKKEKIK